MLNRTRKIAFKVFGMVAVPSGAVLFSALPAAAGDGGGLPGWGYFLIAFLVIVAGATVIFSIINLKRIKQYEDSVQKAENPMIPLDGPYKEMVGNAGEGMLILQQLEFRYANPKFYDLLGMEQEDQSSFQIVEYIYPKDLDAVLEAYEKVMIGREKSAGFTARFTRTDESPVWVSARFVPFEWEGAPAILGLMRDITAQKMMEKDLHQAQRMEAIGALSGGIAHDFNNILTTIIGTAEVTLMDLAEDQPYHEEFEQIRKSGYRARDLVRQILTISRENVLDVQPLYLNSMIKEAVKLLRSTLPKNIKILENFEKELNLVKADSIQIYQVFMNLCTNASDAVRSSAEPFIEINLKNDLILPDDPRVSKNLTPGRYVVIRVKDNGRGIDKKISDRIFEPYFTTKDAQSRTGLGLATTLGIVKQHEGCIDFESSREKGTCFNVYLPAYDPDEKKADRLPDKQNGDERRARILFVDDEVEITTIAERMLNHLGYSVMGFNSPRKALEAFSRSPESFDMIITDLSMPEMTGEKLAKAVLRIRPGFPIIMCTGYSDTFDGEAAKKAGISAYIEKPYDFSALSQLISTFLSGSRAAGA